MIPLSSGFAVRKGFIFLVGEEASEFHKNSCRKKADDSGILLEFDFHFFGLPIF